MITQDQAKAIQYCGHCRDNNTFYTAYGGPAAPREPGDPSIANMAELEESREFWTTHALAVGGPPTGPEEWA